MQLSLFATVSEPETLSKGGCLHQSRDCKRGMGCYLRPENKIPLVVREPEAPQLMFTGGKDMKPYPSADYTCRVYTEREMNDSVFRTIVEKAAEMWSERCAKYVAQYGDSGTCVLGACIEVRMIPNGCRKQRDRRLINVPSTAAQGASTWEESVHDIVKWLGEHGIEARYECGFSD